MCAILPFMGVGAALMGKAEPWAVGRWEDIHSQHLVHVRLTPNLLHLKVGQSWILVEIRH